ncbi:hypothetical protein ACLKA6_009440 [Drosophila palustris]
MTNETGANSTPQSEPPASSGTSAIQVPGRIEFLQLKTRAIFDRLESMCSDMDADTLARLDEYGLNCLLESANELKNSFIAAHTGLEELNFESISSDLPGKFDSALLGLKATLQRELGKRNSSQHCSTFRVNTTDSQSILVMSNRSRLPQLTLPQFSGAYADWTTFFSMFNAVIEKETELTPVEKLQHLRSCLSGAALDTIRSLEINEANYNIAMGILKDRFDNKRLILQAHVREIFGLDKVDASASKLRELTDKVTSHLRALESLAKKDEIADCFLVHTLLQKLDKHTQTKWEETSSSSELPSWEKLKAFLEKRCRTLENVDYAMHINQVGKSSKVPAAFLAIRAMHQLAKDECSSFPLGSQVVLGHFYVDDMISGGSSLEEVRAIMHQTTNLLAKGNFQLRKWCSSRQDALHDIPESERESFVKFNDSLDVTKTLGLVWNPNEDSFLFTFSSRLSSASHTKRSVLSTIARFYDPLGLIGPTMTRAKIILQRMWRDKLQWDESLPQSLSTTWSNFCKDFSDVCHAKYMRYVLMPGATFEIHAFCDASLDAYGACIYVLSYKDDRIQSHLLCSKARVAPLKTLTVPKLELCAAHLLALLIQDIVKMRLFDCRIHCWSDSSVVLSWLQQEPSKFNVFVANRICAIQQLTEGMEWHYVPTAMNPADMLSRGSSPRDLLHSELWLHGPSFLVGAKSDWPQHCLSDTQLPEMRQKILLATSDQTDISTSFKYINSFGTMQRIFGHRDAIAIVWRYPNAYRMSQRPGMGGGFCFCIASHRISCWVEGGLSALRAV